MSAISAPGGGQVRAASKHSGSAAPQRGCARLVDLATKAPRGSVGCVRWGSLRLCSVQRLSDECSTPVATGSSRRWR
eukprot:6204231-Pyramimonas_sp.AAC.2